MMFPPAATWTRAVGLRGLNSNIIIEEIAKTISRLLNNIVPGLDGIPNKALKTYRPLIVPWLADIARAYFIIGYFPRLRRAI